MGGLFFQPRDLPPMPLSALLDYARECVATLDQARSEFHEIRGELRAIARGVRQDAFWTFSGFALAVGSIITTPFFTPAGAGALFGGAGSLVGVKGYLEKSARRGELRHRNRAVQKSIDFCDSELARIEQELAKRSGL